MKAILVIDMPVNGCESCMFGTYGCRCLIKANMLDIEKMNDSTYCPLRPMPEFQQYRHSSGSFTRGFTKGWNSCLKEITGETE